MGVIGKDFKYKVIKNFLSKDEVNFYSTYCEIKHRINYVDFDPIIRTADTFGKGDPAMDTLMLLKQKKMEEETGKKLLPTYSYWRVYTKFADLKKHTDRESCEISVTVSINGDKPWPIYINGKPITIDKGDAIIYLGRELEHWREEFDGDHQIQTFLHYVDADGIYKDFYMDKRQYWGLLK